MAEVTGLRNNALPYPVYAAPFGVTFGILDADGDLVTGATALDSEVSKNGDTFADCTNEATEIATSSGVYYLLLTATEMTADVVTVIVKTTSSGAKTTTITLYPRKLVTLRSGTAQGGAAGYITLDASAGARDDRWNGCLCVATIDTLVEARIITDYTGSNQQAAVTPNWNVTPDSDDTFIIYLPEGMQNPTVNVSHINEQSQTARDIGASVLLSSGTGTGQLDFTSGVVKANVTQYGGSNGTFSSGRPEVNATHWTGQAIPATSQTGVPLVDVRYYGGTAGAFSGGIPAVNITQYLGTSLLSVTIPVDVIAIDSQTVNAAAAVNFEAYVGSAGAYLSPGNIADGVWDEAQSGHTSAGTFGKYLDTEVSGVGGGGLTAADIWDYATASATTVGSMGKLIVDNLDATITSRLADASYTAPDNAGIANIYAIANDGSYGNAAIATLVSSVSNLIGTPAVTVSGDIASLNTLIQDVPTVSEFEARTLPSADYFDPAADTVANVTTVSTLTGHTPQTADVGKLFVRSNTTQSGSTSMTIKLDASASATNNLYRGLVVLLTGGTGAGQARTITGYNGTTKIANVDRAWITTPDNTSTFALLGLNNPSLNTNLQVSASTAQAVIRSGTAQSGSTSNTIKLDASASATNSIYVGNIVTITGGTGLGQSRSITAYVGATKVATVDRNWITTPDNTSTFAIYANTTPTTFSDQGVAQAAASGSITLAATASATNDIYVGSLVTILSGTAAGETSEITAYNGTTKVATVSPSWGVTPDSTSAYAVIPTRGADAPPSIPTAAEIRAEIDLNSTKTGYILAASGLDSITTTAPTGVASNFREMLVQVWRRFFKKTEYNNALNTIKTYADDGTTVVTTQTATSASGVETQGPAT